MRSPGDPLQLEQRGLGVRFCPLSIDTGAGDTGEDIPPSQGVHNPILETDTIIP